MMYTGTRVLSASSTALVVECWLRVQKAPGSIPRQGPHHYVTKMVPVVPLFISLNIKRDKYINKAYF